jgi:hypothetical protein
MEFFIMYSKVQILVICYYEYDVGMNGDVKFVETWDRNSEIGMWNLNMLLH